jgi:hypothetical protein
MTYRSFYLTSTKETLLVLNPHNNPRLTSLPCTRPFISFHLIMPGPWDEVTERKLLLCLVDPNIKANWGEVAASMGPGFTNESVRYVSKNVLD